MKLIDLTASICAGMPKPPSAPAVEMEYIIKQSAEKEAQNGFSNKLEQFTITTHVSTHFDAPSHFTAAGKNIDDYPLDFFYMVPTLVLDIPKGDYEEITERDIKSAESTFGAIQKGDFVIINTELYKRYGDESYMRVPFLTEGAARYLADRGAKIVGIDTFTVDDPREKAKPAHVVLLKEFSIPVVEFVINLDKLPTHRFKSICFPLLITDGSGAFTRLVAVIE